MKKINYIILFIIIFLSFQNVKAFVKYEKTDYVYFDPVTDNFCDESNYWTIYNEDTTCYRFVVLDKEDTTSKSSLKVMLDHNIGVDTFDNYKNILNTNTSNWKRYNGIIDIIDEDTIYNVMELKERPVIDPDNPDKNLVNTGIMYANYGIFGLNSSYYIDGKSINNHGYWSKDMYADNESYAYAVNENGNNNLVLKTQKRGIRPVIEVDKNLIKKSKDLTVDYTNKIVKTYQYSYTNEQYDNYVYKGIQGFTIAKDKLIFHANSSVHPDKGLLYTYNGENFSNLVKVDYRETGHGNDLTYNSKTNKVLLLGIDRDVLEYNADTMEYEKKYTTNLVYAGIGYDAINNYYVGGSGRRIYIMNSNFGILYSFDLPFEQISQGLEFHNGYVYKTTYEGGNCPNSSQIYCSAPAWSSMTYVYNARLKSDGTPDKNFGKLAKKIYIDAGIGELESISFTNDKTIFGYYSGHYDSEYTRKFYTIDNSESNPILNYNVSVSGTKRVYKIVITSDSEIKPIEGWTLSNDKHSLIKDIENSFPTLSVNVCDNYNNCRKTSIDTNELTKNLEDESDIEIVPPSNNPENDKTEETEVKVPSTASNTSMVIGVISFFMLIYSIFVIYEGVRKKYDDKN